MLPNLVRRARLLARGLMLFPAAAAMLLPGAAHATLHAFCVGTPACTDNNTVTPTKRNPPDFGFLLNPGSGTATSLLLEVLIPDNVSNAGSESVSINGHGTGTRTASASAPLSAKAWTSGQLQDYIDTASGSRALSKVTPKNPIGAFLPTTNSLYAPTHPATGYYVHQLGFGSADLSGTSTTFSTSFDFPLGSMILAYADICGRGGNNCSWDATANSGTLAIEGLPSDSLEGRQSVPTVPEPASMGLFGSGMALLAWLIMRRRPTG